MDIIIINTGMIRLGQLLKVAGLADTGGEAKAMIQGGEVLVNNEVEPRRGRQLHHGDLVEVAGRSVQLATPVLLCSDLDRTILPNGAQPESPEARPLLRGLAEQPEIILAYVSGRHLALLQEAIAQYELPLPRFAVCDVGTTIYEIKNDEWRPWQAWSDQIAPDWLGLSRQDIAKLLAPIKAIQQQEEEKQNFFKLSYYAPADTNGQKLIGQADDLLGAAGIKAGLIWSVDETTATGLFDVLPASATKLHAVRFLMNELSITETRTVYAGDSGNDLPVLTSGLQSVLVKNAIPDVRDEALERLKADGLEGSLYQAQGDFMGLNGNYTAGVLEGLCHFVPDMADLLKGFKR